MRALLWLGLTACTWTPDDFAVQVADATCDLQEDCFGAPVDPTACVPQPAPDDPECLFDSGRAQACVRGIDQMDCPEPGEPPVFPAACDRVWDCGG